MPRLSVVLVAAALAAACSSKPKPAKPDTGTSVAGKRRGGDDDRNRKAGTGDAVRTDAQDGQGNTVRLGPVYFDFDSTRLRPDAREELVRIAFR